MKPDELFEATAQAMLSALERDAASGWGAVVYTITPEKVFSFVLMLSFGIFKEFIANFIKMIFPF